MDSPKLSNRSGKIGEMLRAEPVASIVMLAYNHGPYLAQAIESILQQETDFAFELIVAEDCSKDNTRAIALSYERANPEVVRVVTSKKNVGAHENLRRSEALCRGRYIAYCEGDDYWNSKRKLQIQVEFLEAHSDYSMIHSDCRWHDLEFGRLVENAVSLREGLNDMDAFNELLSGRRIIWTVSVCVRRTILQAVLRESPECYDPRFLMGDTQRFLEIARRGKVKYQPEALATRQALLESATRSKNAARVLRFAFSAKDVLDHYIDKYGCPDAVAKVAKRRSTTHVLSCAFEAGDVQTAKAMIRECREHGIPVPLKGQLYAIGSRSTVLRALCRPVLGILILGQKVQRRLSRMLKSEGSV